MFNVYSGLIFRLLYRHLLTITIWSIISLIAIYISVVAAAMESLNIVTINRPSNNIITIIDTVENKEIDIQEYCSIYFCPNKENVITIVSNMYERPYLVRFITFFYDDLKICIFNKQFMMYVDFNHYRDKMFELYLKLACLFILMYIVSHVVTTVNRYKNVMVYDRNNKSDISNELQKDLTESLHHELALPLAIIKSKTRDLFLELNDYLQEINKNIVKDGSREIDKLYDLSAVELPEKIKTIQENVLVSIKSIDSTLEIIASKRKVASSNEDTSFLDVLNVTLKMYKSFQVKKIEYEIENIDTFKRCYVNNGMGNGNIINILTVMLNNAVEAKSTKLLFSGELSMNKRYLYLTIKDDGSGINIDKKHGGNNMVFRFGYSTKANNNNNNNNNWLRTIINILDPTVLPPNISNRGAGLALVRQLLIRFGGDIRITKTSSEGTEFLLIIPVQAIE